MEANLENKIAPQNHMFLLDWTTGSMPHRIIQGKERSKLLIDATCVTTVQRPTIICFYTAQLLQIYVARSSLFLDLVGSCLGILRKPLKVGEHGKLIKPLGRFGE